MSQMLYRYPGPHKLHGDNFDYIIVDESEIEETIEEGWFLTTTEAKEKSPLNIHPPTREELEIKADELGISFDGRTADKTLSKKIQEALDELE